MKKTKLPGALKAGLAILVIIGAIGALGSQPDTTNNASTPVASEVTAETPSIVPTTAPVQQAPATPVPAAEPVAQQSACNPNYSGCVENSSYDLDCADVGQEVRVIGTDEYRLDRDGDGYGCESY